MGFYSGFKGFGREPLEVQVPTARTPREVIQSSFTLADKFTQARIQAQQPVAAAAPPAIVGQDYDSWYAALPLVDKAKYALSKPVIGPVKVWHLLAAAGLAGAGYVVYKRRR